MKEEEKNKGTSEDSKTEVIEIDGKGVPVDELTNYYKNKAKFESEFHKKGELVNQLEAKTTELEAKLEQLGAKNEPENQNNKPPNPDEDPSAFIEYIAKSAEKVQLLEQKLAQMEQGLHADTVDTVNRHNFTLLENFVKKHNISEDKIDNLKKLAAAMPGNIKRAGGQTIEVIPESLENAFLLINKDEIRKKASDDGKNELLEELLHGVKLTDAKGNEDKKEDSDSEFMAWFAEKYDVLSDAEIEKGTKRMEAIQKKQLQVSHK